ncbi:unnamed protein product [Timema podura]|uniref:Uncharacterized protein n=1 Tax=Timema podura TaxID=61482 RepID=A0ABN7PG10_TIMPD|nr:unnamed protein product [Timema podura]
MYSLTRWGDIRVLIASMSFLDVYLGEVKKTTTSHFLLVSRDGLLSVF